MDKNITIVITKVANGFLVRPYVDFSGPTDNTEIKVFQDMGYASTAHDYQATKDTLLGFVQEHFSDGKENTEC